MKRILVPIDFSTATPRLLEVAGQLAKSLDAELTKLKINHTYKDRDGGHVWPVWRWALSEYAPLIFKK